ncbi:ABC transporter permease [Candidatus Bipolaricaulota bacterium]|nr:ABC transporter permease [Candidatus Bipolaricaulota bacterium]
MKGKHGKRFGITRVGLALLERRSVLLLGLLAVILFAFGITTPRFVSYPMFRVITSHSAEIGLMGLGMGLAWMVNGVDLSVNDTANLSAFTAALTLKGAARNGSVGLGWLLVSYLVAILTGLLCGVLNGILIGYLDVPPILATLGGMTLYRGISIAVTKGRAVAGLPEAVALVGRGMVLGIPVPFLVFLGIYAVMYFVLNYTSFGFKARMVGINVRAAYFSGVNYRRVIMSVYVVSGLLASVAGIIIMGRTRSVAYEYGTQTYIVFALLITNLAGVSAGYYGITAAVLATLTLQILSTGFYSRFMTLPGGPFFNNFLWGLFLVAVLVFAQLLERLRLRT